MQTFENKQALQGAVQISYDASKAGKGYAKPSDLCHTGGTTLSSYDNCYFNILRKLSACLSSVKKL